MDWIQFILFGLGVGGIWLWNRAENRSDLRHMDVMLQANRELIREIHNEIQQEMKEFHNRLALQDQEFKLRLCAIEEKNKSMK